MPRRLRAFGRVAASVAPLVGDAGHLRGSVKVGRARTERKRSEEERDRIGSRSLDMLCGLGLDGYFKRVTPRSRRHSAIRFDGLPAAPIIKCLHSDDRSEIIAGTKQLAAGGQTDYLKNRFRRTDGSYAWTGWTYFPGAEEGLAYGTRRDITQSRELLSREQAARRSRTRQPPQGQIPRHALI